MPPTTLGQELLKSISEHSELPPDTWYIIAATTFALLNLPDEVPKVYEYAINHGTAGETSSLNEQEQLHVVRRIREALIKTSAVGGAPKIINSLLALKKITPAALLDQPLAETPTLRREDFSGSALPQITQRGQDFFASVYGKVAERVMSQMDNSGTEDLGLVASLMYSHILSNTSVLSAKETSFVMIAALVPQDVNPQLKGHLKGAMNGGAKLEEVRAVREVVIKICESAGMTKLEDGALTGWGWREDVASI